MHVSIDKKRIFMERREQHTRNKQAFHDGIHIIPFDQ